MKNKPKKSAPTELNHTTNSSNSFVDYLTNIESYKASKTTDEQIEYITNKLFGPGVNSKNRLPVMLSFLNDFAFQPEVVWPVFHAIWNACDATWECHDELIEFLELMECLNDGEGMRPIDHLSPADKAAFAALPKHVRIYRGCSISCVYGFSWTTDRIIAEEFARGHRGISVPDPVIASLRIPKNRAFSFYTSRKENEILVEPCNIAHNAITVTRFMER